MYLAQRQLLFFSPDRIPVWQNDGDVSEVTLEQLVDKKQCGGTASEDPNDRDVLIVTGPSRRERYVIISETQRQAWELYYALKR